MNERIKELARQANITIVPEPFDDASRAWNENIKKFAESIVRECADVCDLYGMPDGTSETAIILSAAIKRKFGVE